MAEHKDGPKAVSWGGKESQEIRFKVLGEIGDIAGKSVLDVGCGLGDLYNYLKDRNVGYTGCDIVPEMVEAARKKYPEAKFIDKFPNQKFDYVFESGIFNLETENWMIETNSMIYKMFEMANIGIGINFLSSLSLNQKENSHYANPLDVIQFICLLTNKWSLRHDYKQNDFTIYAFK